jgi:hypothetical protein
LLQLLRLSVASLPLCIFVKALLVYFFANSENRYFCLYCIDLVPFFNRKV